MSMRATKLQHFLARSGSYSTHGYGGGRVDVLPPHAIEPTWNNLRQQQIALRKQLKQERKNGTMESRAAIRKRQKLLKAELRALSS